MISHRLNPTISTRAWIIEMDKDDAQDHTQEILETLNHQASVTAVPMTTRQDSTGIIECAMLHHNSFLCECATIRVDNVCNMSLSFPSVFAIIL